MAKSNPKRRAKTRAARSRRTATKRGKRASAARPGKGQAPARRQSPPKLLAEDIPEKVQAEYRLLLGEGLESKAATKQLVASWKKLLTTKPLKEQFWLAMAGTQWQLGRLDSETKKKALACIDAVLKTKKKPRRSADEERAAANRREALTSLRGILTSQQPPKKEIPRHRAPSSDDFEWPVGEVFAYKLLSGRYALFHVVARLGQPTIGFWPVFALLDWIGDSPPPAGEIQNLPLKTDPHSTGEESIWMVSVLRRHPSDFSPERVEWLRVKRPPHANDIETGFSITYWREKLDEKLRFDFGWE